MRHLLLAFVLGAAIPAFASDLAQANRLLEAKSYPQAIDLLSKLAGQGDSAAQLRLGQVYWYGEGVSVDRAKADALFAQAAAAGNKEAVQAKSLTVQRESHLKDISYWTGGYTGADLVEARDACARPAVPERSVNNKEIKATQAAVANWQSCYKGFLNRMAVELPAGKAIPAQVLDVMSDEEVERAKTHLDAVYKRIADEASTGANQTLAAYGAWEKATNEYVQRENGIAESRDRQQRVVNERDKGFTRPDIVMKR